MVRISLLFIILQLFAGDAFATEEVDQYFQPSYLAKVYDDLSATYIHDRYKFDNYAQLDMLNKLITLHSTILDVGCGNGLPAMKYFANKGHMVIGNDMSTEMIKYVKNHLPQCQLIKGDMLELDLKDQTLDLITSFYAIFHIDRVKHRELFQNFYRMLKQGGYAYFTLAGKEYTNSESYHGTKVFQNKKLPYSHYSKEEYIKILEQIGFEICLITELEINHEIMSWILIRRPEIIN